MSAITAADVHLAELIARVVGPNSEYPSSVQLAFHRERQIYNERFISLESKEVLQ